MSLADRLGGCSEDNVCDDVKVAALGGGGVFVPLCHFMAAAGTDAEGKPRSVGVVSCP